MPSPSKVLERDFQALKDSNGADCIRALIRLDETLKKNRAIRKAVRTIERRARKAEKQFDKKDELLIAELKTYQARFLHRVPEGDDRDKKRERAPASSVEGLQWANTMANFEEIMSDGPDQLIRREGLDGSRSGVLASILLTRIEELRWPRDFDPEVAVPRDEDQRPDLAELSLAVGDVSKRQKKAYRDTEKELEDSGYVALIGLRGIVKACEYKYRPANTENEQHEAFNEMFLEVSAGHHSLQQAVRPPEAGVTLSRRDQESIDYYVEKVKSLAPRLEFALSTTLERKRSAWWSRLDGSSKIGIVGILSGLLIGAASIFAAIKIG